MNTVSRSRRTLVRVAAVAACAGPLLAFPAAAALADGLPSATSAHAGAAPRTLVQTLSLADGVSKAKVYRVAKGAFQADVLTADGTRTTTLTSSDGIASFGDAGELHLALQADGRLSSWVGDDVPTVEHAVAGAGHKTASRDGVVVPASDVTDRAGASRPAEALRLHTLADGPGGGVLLLAAGGGIAAIGAAGLGFAMLRRGRTEEA
ncbi:hypothetical protein [Streptomyces sp. NBC_00503]|uniref:hypothetical protein n=1 Tax=Streptomyces sp. NBC_00503 TaxID=2903659 RepID=UPI002E8060D1|nr:hypothetical protein [Streptomyces sp. NBC_00503]WUD83603.1 hypothetical protein OG490_25315 [Streptomyces sp. NBC_00503]